MKNNTYTTAYDACENYFSETGQIPTIESIKNIIGTNSPNTISAAIKDWKKALSKSAGSTSYSNSNFPAPLFAAVSTIWEQALREAKKTFDENFLEINSKQVELERKENELYNEKTRLQHLLRLSEQKYINEIRDLKTELSQLSVESAKSSEQVEHAKSLASEYKKEIAVLHEQLKREQENLSRLDSQYNKEHEWALKRIEEEKNNYKQNVQNEMERIKTESYKSNQAKELFQKRLDSMSKQMNEYMERIIELERKLADEKVTQAKMMTTEAKLQNELYIREERIRTLIQKTKND